MIARNEVCVRDRWRTRQERSQIKRAFVRCICHIGNEVEGGSRFGDGAAGGRIEGCLAGCEARSIGEGGDNAEDAPRVGCRRADIAFEVDSAYIEGMVTNFRLLEGRLVPTLRHEGRAFKAAWFVTPE